MTCSSSSGRRLVRAALAGLAALALGAGCSGESGGPTTPTGDGGAVPGVKIETSPASIPFGEVLVGTTGPTVTVTVTNRGMETSAALVVTTSDKVFKVVTNGCPGALASLQTCTLAVAFAPDAVGPKAGTLDVASGANKGTSMLAGNGTLPATLSVTPSQKNFGDVVIGGESAPVTTFMIKNEGGADGPRPTISVTDGFAIKGGTCGTVANLAKGATCTADVVFSPSVIGTKSGTLTAALRAAPATRPRASPAAAFPWARRRSPPRALTSAPWWSAPPARPRSSRSPTPAALPSAA
jgi:hypothetical protein